MTEAATPLPWSDIGLNLGSSQFDADREAVVHQAQRAGVTRMLLTGTSLNESACALQLARQFHQLATAGVHPHHASEWSDETQRGLSALLAETQVRAVGECGLDFNRNFSTPAEQEQAFAAQIELAIAVQKPLFLHCRDAHARFVELLKPARAALCGGVAHCFTGDASELRALLDLDLYIGITGWICDERRGAALCEALRFIPLDRLLLETDAPYLIPRDLPQAKKSRRNLPAYLPHIAARVSQITGIPLPELSDKTEANFTHLFGPS